ncbi:MAG: type II toxin-antitoxin system Phd/YefM family antitoxin [Pseudomonadales bacterium]|nr:type II toxin-antitoxin system Phd/YefM family antitoxin [Pseudomonadales bacterium]
MKVINIYQAKTQLSQLVDRSLAGEEIVIGRYGKPVVSLQVVAPTPTRSSGLLEGKIVIPKDFDDENPVIEALFYE